MTNELEDVVRGMLHDRAQDVTAFSAGIRTALDAEAGPETTDPHAVEFEVLGRPDIRLPSLDGARRRRRHLTELSVAAAAVIALGVAGAVVATDHHGSSPAATTTCAVPATKAWTKAWTDAGVQIAGVPYLGVAGVDLSGAALVSPTAYAGPEPVFRVAPGGRTAAPVARIPANPNGSGAAQDQTLALPRGDQLVIVDFAKQRAGTSTQTTDIRLVDLNTGRTRTITTDPGLTPDAYAQGGTVYYQLDTHAGQAIKAYDIRTGAVRTVARYSRGADVELAAGAVGVWWSDHGRVELAPGVPRAVAKAATSGRADRSSFVTDGRTWAWSTGGATVGWSDTSGTVHTLAGVLGAKFHVTAAAGPYVVLSKNTVDRNPPQELFDTRSGAITPVPSGLSVAQGDAGTLLGSPVTHGGSVPGPKSGTLIRLDTAKLPRLSC